MFESHLSSRLALIFDLPKVSYDMPSDISEQECLFIEIKQARVRVSDGFLRARVEGECRIWAQRDKMPFGYLSKQIQRAPKFMTDSFFFYDIEEGRKMYQNIIEKLFKFVFFFEGQYDPNLGEIDSINFSAQYEV
jgi:hypothetical protein